MKMITSLAITGAAIISAIYFALPTVARVVLSRDEINACASQIALKEDYKGDILSYLVDNGAASDFIAVSDSYHRSIGLDTVYTSWVRKGTKLCIQLKLTGQPIPKQPTEADLPKGYHITRWNGSASLVKDGEPEPVFSCMDGYHPTGSACVRN